ncbi:MAG: hypothetical protein N2645_22565 [Clostridia bacterium]|nr:hypothetical protein [Clostridia bacterium]
MRTKINQSSSYIKNSYFLNDIYRKFSKQFNYLLNPDMTSLFDIAEEELYVDTGTVERQLLELSEPDDKFYYMIGYTGIGKTCTIKHCFKIENNKPIVNSKMELIFPTFFDPTNIENSDIRGHITRRLRSLSRCLENKYTFLTEFYRNEQVKNDFFDFIDETKTELLDYSESDGDEYISKEGKLKLLFRNNPFAYELCKLKFYLSNDKVNIKNVIIIVDDIESLPDELEIDAVSQFLRIYTCLKNNRPCGKSRKYSTKLLISGRPYTFRYLNFKRQFESYPINKEISKNVIPDLAEIFLKRFNKVNEKLDLVSRIGNKEQWENAFNVVTKLCNKLDRNFADTISRLNHYNIRHSMVNFAEVLSNKQWIQKQKYRSSSFTIDGEDYSINKATVLKALACGEGIIYIDHSNTNIPNILHNEMEEGYELLGAYVVKYFLKHQAENALYGFSSIDINDFYDNVSIIFSEINDIKGKFAYIVDYLFSKKVLLRSIYEPENPEDKGKYKKISVKKLYLSQRGYVLWDLLSNDSVLFELYRDDLYRDIKKYSQSASNLLLQEEVLLDCVKYLEEIFEIEAKYISIANNSGNLRNYFNAFGTELITLHILRGIENSIRYFFKDPQREIPPEILGLKNALKAKVLNYTELLDKNLNWITN